MSPVEQSALWTTAPGSWPGAPEIMTVSTLFEIETCPRRWSLASADYQSVWSGRGYPPRLQLSSVGGSVVHLVLETIISELVRAGCPSVEHPHAIQVMRHLGGYSKVVQDCIARVLRRFAANPRASRVLSTATQTLMAQVPELRAQAQTLLSRVQLPNCSSVAARTPSAGERRALSQGAYAEVELRAKRIGWKGKADLIVISADSCEITDVKTGEPADSHRFQLWVYALLWSRDAELNPTGLLASRLTLAYAAGNVDVDVPSAQELDASEDEIVSRAEAAKRAVSERPPLARPSVENCRYCTVKHMCTEYWSLDTQRNLARPVVSQDGGFSDVEVMITGRHGPSSWDAVIEIARNFDAETPALVRTSQGVLDVRPGQRLRILDAHMATVEDDENQPVVITVGSFSEAYLVRHLQVSE